MNHEADSVEQVKIIAETLNGQCRYVVVKNQAQSDYFKIYEQSKLRVRLMEELGGREIVMPKLYDWLVTSLNEGNLPITKGLYWETLSEMAVHFNRQNDLTCFR